MPLGFAHPWILVLWPLLGYLTWRLWRRRPTALVYSDLQLLSGLPRGRSRWQKWPKLCAILAVHLLLLASANPRWPDQKTRLPAEGLCLALLVDVSGSMATVDFGQPPTSRLMAAKQAFQLFIRGGELPNGERLPGRPQDQIGLISFAAVPETVSPLTHQHAGLLQQLEELKSKEGVDAGTNIGDAIAEGVARLEAAKGRNPVLILLSDGEHNIHQEREDRALMPREASQLALALGVKIYAIDCGGDPPANSTAEERQQRQDGQRVLEAITQMTQGQSFRANNPEELQRIFQQIDQLQTDPRPTFRYRRYHELGPWLMYAASTMLLAAAIGWQIRYRGWPD